MIYFSWLAYISCVYDSCCPKDQVKNPRNPKLDIFFDRIFKLFVNLEYVLPHLCMFPWISSRFIERIRDNMCIKFTFLLKALHIKKKGKLKKR